MFISIRSPMTWNGFSPSAVARSWTMIGGLRWMTFSSLTSSTRRLLQQARRLPALFDAARRLPRLREPERASAARRVRGAARSDGRTANGLLLADRLPSGDADVFGFSSISETVSFGAGFGAGGAGAAAGCGSCLLASYRRQASLAAVFGGAGFPEPVLRFVVRFVVVLGVPLKRW